MLATRRSLAPAFRRAAASLLVALLAGGLHAGCGGNPPRDDEPRREPDVHDSQPRVEPGERETRNVMEDDGGTRDSGRTREPARQDPPPARAASGTVSVNRGESAGIQQGEEYDVFAQGEAMVDPDTGEVLGSSETKVARIRITQVLPKFSKGNVLGGRPAKGDICRPAQGPPEFATSVARTPQPQRKGKATLAVAPLTYHRSVKAPPGCELETDLLTQKFVTGLVKTNKFDVVERSRVDTLMTEIEFGQSGLADPTRAVKAGKMLGADYFLMGEISVFTLTTTVKPVPHTERFFRTRELRLIVDLRVVNTATTKIGAAQKGDVSIKWKKMFPSRPAADEPVAPAQLDEIQRKLIDQLLRKVIDTVYPLKILSVAGSAPPPPAPRDTTPPSIELLEPRAGATLERTPVQVAVRVRDAGGVAKVTINGANAAQSQNGLYRVRISRPNEGTNGLQIKAWDRAGNEAGIRGSFVFQAPDTSGPRIRIVTPQRGQSVTSTPVGIVAQVEDDRGVSKVTINGQEVSAAKSNAYRLLLRKPLEGENRVRVEAWDAAGNHAQAESTFTYVPPDRIPPRIRVLAPKEGKTLNTAPVTVVVSVTDDRKVHRVAINNVDARANADDGNYYARLARPLDGTNRIRVDAWDEAGNQATAETSFVFDSTPPEVEADAMILVEGKVDDLEAKLTINGVPVEFDRTTGRYSVRVPANPDKPGKVEIIATDAYGNQTKEIRSVR